METRAQLGAVPRSAIILATLALLAALAAGSYAVATTGSGTSSLLPTGPAGNGLMAYSDGDIWVVDPDGTDARQLTSGPAEDQTASWSRDGMRLAYWSVDATGAPSSLVVIEPDGSDPVTVFTDEAGRTPAGIDWSPDGTRIAFALCPEEPCGDFFVVASDGSGSSMIGGPAFESHALAWSPDGETVAFGGRHAGGPEGVYVMAPDGSAVQRISQATDLAGFASVAWSPDGRILTHAGTDETGPDIWTVAADGSGEVNLTEGPATGFLPGWSPDGAWAAFRDGDIVFLVPGEGGDVRTFGLGAGFAWSPDGSVLALEGDDALRLVDVVTGDVIAELAGVPGVESWQRLAP
jgi:Tol biopolymer transport system component